MAARATTKYLQSTSTVVTRAISRPSTSIYRSSRPQAQLCQTTPALSHSHIQFRSISNAKMMKDQAKGHHQARPGETEGLSEWKKRAPYKIHESNEDFKVRYEASCHCGRVKYQLSREEPLDSKLCHCTTCQTQHGKSYTSAAACVNLESDEY